jgi:hypothetical protein
MLWHRTRPGTMRPLPPSVKLGGYTVPLPFECYCCPGFVTDDETELLRHLTELNYHAVHSDFLVTNAPIPQEDLNALKAFDLFVPPAQTYKVAIFLAKISHKAPAGAPSTPAAPQAVPPAASGPLTSAPAQSGSKAVPPVDRDPLTVSLRPRPPNDKPELGPDRPRAAWLERGMALVTQAMRCWRCGCTNERWRARADVKWHHADLQTEQTR